MEKFVLDKNIILAADHNGVLLKNQLIDFLKNSGYNCIDLGPYTDEKKVDYVHYANQLRYIVNNNQVKRGIIICGTGVGMSIVVNKYPRVMAALVHNLDTARKCREHNDSNVLCLGAWIITKEQSIQIVDNWLNEPFGEGRHVKRIEKIVPHDKEKVVFTNGVFDVLHTGHIELLKFAKSLGGRLIVGLNSDRSAKSLKGKDNVINSEIDRRHILESIEYVDEVIIFDEDKPTELIKKLDPHIIVKGGEYKIDDIRKTDNIPDEIEVKVFPLVDDYLVINLLEKIKSKK